MSSKLSSTQVSSPDEVRNVVLIGNAGSGKTSLFEQLLKARVTGYRGEKDDPERAAQLYLASFINESVVVNLLDAPGHPDFVGELRAGIRAADAAIFVVSAADGIDGMAQALWDECENARLPRIIALTKLDAGHADFDSSVSAAQEAFGSMVLPTHVPTLAASGEIAGNIGLISLEEHDYSAGSMQTMPVTAEDSQVEMYRGPLIEGLIQEAEDDSLMDRYLEGEELDANYLLDDLMKAVATANLYPLLPVSSATGVGVEELLALIEHGFPTPSSHPNPEADTLSGDPLQLPETDPAGPLVAQVIRTTTDPFAGRLSMVRIFSGTLKVDDVVHVSGRHPESAGKDDAAHADHDSDERIGGLQGAVGAELKPRPSAIAGEIVLIPKLNSAETGDTLSAKERPSVVSRWSLPDPLLPLAVRAATRNDEDKFSGALQRLAVEDSTVRVDRGGGDQLVIWTTGQAHADLLLNRLTDRYGVKVEQEEIRIPLRETFIGKAVAEGRHVKQSGGHGQYAKCNIEVEPMPRGEGFEFVDKVVGGSVPRQFIPSVEKGVRAQLEKGVIAGYPMVDVRVTLYDGKAHSVDSSDMAFQLAGQLAIKEAAKPTVTALLEPVDLVTVTVGEEYLGPVMTDLSGRRGQLLGSDSVNRKAVIRALVPQLELSRYAIDLRGIAHGSGTFTREFHGYELLPAHLMDKFLTKN
ncbi:MAG: elongation factor G-like protein EF-G2 [Propionibacteriaceae bacterium]|jgi:elongation factor G|nr:elongation factor G-like protein EF-G2 [Propionibacteriaceae bacterium]